MMIFKCIVSVALFVGLRYLNDFIILYLLDSGLQFDFLSENYGFITDILVFFQVLFIIGFERFGGKYNQAISSSKWFFIAFISGAIFLWIQTPLNLVYNYFSGSGYVISYDFIFENTSTLNVFSVVFLVPIYEELFFRFYIQRSLHAKFSPLFSILIASLLFGAAHLPFYELLIPGMEIQFSFHHAYITFFGGLIAGWLFYKSKTVFPSIIMHVMWNLFATHI